MYIKLFDIWGESKKILDKREILNNKKNFIRVGEIRWVSIGVNIGKEIDGKGNSFSRPCLIYKKVANGLFLVIPITSKIKDFYGYLPISIKNKENTLCLLHMRSISENRILERMTKLSQNKFIEIKKLIFNFFE